MVLFLVVVLATVAWPVAAQECDINATVSGYWSNQTTWAVRDRPPCGVADNTVCIAPNVTLLTHNNDSSVEELQLERESGIELEIGSSLFIGVGEECDSIAFPTTTTATTRTTTATTTRTTTTTTTRTTPPNCQNESFCALCAGSLDRCRTCVDSHYVNLQGRCTAKVPANTSCPSSAACISGCCKSVCVPSSECQNGKTNFLLPAIIGAAVGVALIFIIIIVVIVRRKSRTRQFSANKKGPWVPNALYEPGALPTYESADLPDAHRQPTQSVTYDEVSLNARPGAVNSLRENALYAAADDSLPQSVSPTFHEPVDPVHWPLPNLPPPGAPNPAVPYEPTSEV